MDLNKLMQQASALQKQLEDTGKEIGEMESGHQRRQQDPANHDR